MIEFVSGKGCVVKMFEDEHAATSLYSITGLDALICKLSEDQSLMIIDSIDISKQDAVLPKDALNDKHALYVYGTTFSQVAIKGTLYLGNSAKDRVVGQGIVQKLQTWFEENRVSAQGKNKQLVQISIASGFKGNAYIMKLRFGDTDPKVNAMGFAIEGVIEPGS